MQLLERIIDNRIYINLLANCIKGFCLICDDLVIYSNSCSKEEWMKVFPPHCLFIIRLLLIKNMEFISQLEDNFAFTLNNFFLFFSSKPYIFLSCSLTPDRYKQCGVWPQQIILFVPKQEALATTVWILFSLGLHIAAEFAFRNREPASIQLKLNTDPKTQILEFPVC